jgi:hypothetical protein
MARKRNTRFKSFEGTKENDRHIRQTDSMMDSLAWMDLSLAAKVLYGEIKRRYTGDNHTRIELPHSSLIERKVLSKNIITNTFDSLVKHGFIEVIREGGPARTANQYALSDKWQQWPKVQPRGMSRINSAPATMGAKIPKVGVTDGNMTQKPAAAPSISHGNEGSATTL